MTDGRYLVLFGSKYYLRRSNKYFRCWYLLSICVIVPHDHDNVWIIVLQHFSLTYLRMFSSRRRSSPSQDTRRGEDKKGPVLAGRWCDQHWLPGLHSGVSVAASLPGAGTSDTPACNMSEMFDNDDEACTIVGDGAERDQQLLSISVLSASL